MITNLGASELAGLAAYVPRVVEGDTSAWQELVKQLEHCCFNYCVAAELSGRCVAASTIVVP